LGHFIKFIIKSSSSKKFVIFSADEFLP